MDSKKRPPHASTWTTVRRGCLPHLGLMQVIGWCWDKAGNRNAPKSRWLQGGRWFYFHVRRTNGSIEIPSKIRSWAKHISWLYEHWNAKKRGFQLDVCACVCLCEKVCHWISYERVDRFGWKFRCILQLASNREPPLTSTIGPIFHPNVGRGGFLQFFEPLYLENHLIYQRKERSSRRKIWSAGCVWSKYY